MDSSELEKDVKRLIRFYRNLEQSTEIRACKMQQRKEDYEEFADALTGLFSTGVKEFSDGNYDQYKGEIGV